MRISDWSSDVCSSDLPLRLGSALDHQQQPLGLERFLDEIGRAAPDRGDRSIKVAVARDHQHRDRRIAPFDLVEPVEPVQQRALERSGERRVGKEWVSRCRSRWSPHHKKNLTYMEAPETTHTII